MGHSLDTAPVQYSVHQSCQENQPIPHRHVCLCFVYTHAYIYVSAVGQWMNHWLHEVFMRTNFYIIYKYGCTRCRHSALRPSLMLPRSPPSVALCPEGFNEQSSDWQRHHIGCVGLDPVHWSVMWVGQASVTVAPATVAPAGSSGFRRWLLLTPGMLL